MADSWKWTDLPENATGICVVHDKFKSVTKELEFKTTHLQICADCAGRGIAYVRGMYAERIRLLETDLRELKSEIAILEFPDVWPPT